MTAEPTHPHLILASKSPRRQYLLKQAGVSFTVIPSNFDERTIPVAPPQLYVKLLAEKKAADIAGKYPASWVIGADTIVQIDGDMLGKPVSKKDARRMIARLSGQTHQVYTGVSIRCESRRKYFLKTFKTDVQFKSLTKNEIEWYIQTDEPFDKAGAYAIQGLGTFLVKQIHGSYTNVVGLPVCEVIEYLIHAGAIGPAKGKRWNPSKVEEA